MEHVGKHYEGKGSAIGNKQAEEMKEEEDEDLRAWAVKEGIVKDLGTRGFWLEALAPADCQNGRRGSRGGWGQRAKQQQVKDEVNEDDDDTDAHGEEEC